MSYDVTMGYVIRPEHAADSEQGHPFLCLGEHETKNCSLRHSRFIALDKTVSKITGSFLLPPPPPHHFLGKLVKIL